MLSLGYWVYIYIYVCVCHMYVMQISYRSSQAKLSLTPFQHNFAPSGCVWNSTDFHNFGDFPLKDPKPSAREAETIRRRFIGIHQSSKIVKMNPFLP